ncbi:MAG: hypothetical protein K0S74_1239 [Chlamydiales bacterium]|jgi:hypothetical protein|nr:hypothetical protein [Chlamydiales bacterium]
MDKIDIVIHRDTLVPESISYDYTDSLSAELLDKILSYFNNQENLVNSLVCRRWNKITKQICEVRIKKEIESLLSNICRKLEEEGEEEENKNEDKISVTLQPILDRLNTAYNLLQSCNSTHSIKDICEIIEPAITSIHHYSIKSGKPINTFYQSISFESDSRPYFVNISESNELSKLSLGSRIKLDRLYELQGTDEETTDLSNRNINAFRSTVRSNIKDILLFRILKIVMVAAVLCSIPVIANSIASNYIDNYPSKAINITTISIMAISANIFALYKHLPGLIEDYQARKIYKQTVQISHKQDENHNSLKNNILPSV